MNKKNERQHYVSRVLLERFRIRNSPLECYQVQTRKWKQRSVEKVCSARGYNQLLVSGDVNNAIEDSFSKVESILPKTFEALECAANRSSTELPKATYENLCLYCAFLKRTSLFAKPGAVVSFLGQINMELEKGEFYLLRELKVPDQVVAQFREGYSRGGRIIIESENVLQTVYRLQFERLLQLNLMEFLNCDWTISNSPVDLPMSDIGLIQIHLIKLKAIQYILPIGPRIVLDGIFYLDLTKNSPRPVVGGHKLSAEEAEYRLDVICLSAVKELIFSRRNLDVMASLDRAKSKGITFNKIVNLELATSAGSKNSSIGYHLQMVSTEEYVKFVHSFVQPPNLVAK
jgi:hypothetical protein